MGVAPVWTVTMGCEFRTIGLLIYRQGTILGREDEGHYDIYDTVGGV